MGFVVFGRFTGGERRFYNARMGYDQRTAGRRTQGLDRRHSTRAQIGDAFSAMRPRMHKIGSPSIKFRARNIAPQFAFPCAEMHFLQSVVE